MILSPLALLAVLAAQPPTSPPPTPTDPAEWKRNEAPFLSHHVQLTFPDRYIRAGEQYFDHADQPTAVIFQAIERPKDGQDPDANYAMYVAKLTRDSGGHITGIQEPTRLSPPGSSNTCGWFHPTQPGTVIFGGTLVAPSSTDSPGYSRDRQRYSWQFPKEMEIVRVTDIGSHPSAPTPVFSRPGYDAECSYSKDGRFLIYTHVDTTSNDPNLWIFDTKTSKHFPIVTTKGYDGGPFFSPDGKWICYRSDRKGNNVLQLYLAELAFGDDGDPAVPIGINREIQLTTETPGKDEKEQPVSWCPFFHPSGKYLVYATSEVGHQNYEVFALEVDPAKPTDQLRKARVTHTEGFDGLPVFSADGKVMMWTSQRGPKRADEQRPSSQMWVAEVAGEPAWGSK